VRERRIFTMVRKKNLLWVMLPVVISLISFAGCQYELVKKKRISPEEERALREEQERAEERKIFTDSLVKKKYSGIEGEFEESSLLKDIYFDFDQYDLTGEARRILTENAKVLIAHPSVIIQIEGHCDERGGNEYNLALGERRAVSAKLYLIKLGVQGSRLSTISYGEELPVDTRHTEEAWAKNRRCHFIILSR
jgi:peptidoglycan-associated lipoprotein